MARRVFFSFHYAKDSWRVSQVRNSNVVQSKYERTRFLDAADWEQIKRQGDVAIRNWIDSQMFGTSVTIVLIGGETASRKWVDYEIQESIKRGNGLIGIYIHNLKNQYGQTDYKGQNPIHKFDPSAKIYDWVNDNGRLYIDDWIEEAARKAGR